MSNFSMFSLIGSRKLTTPLIAIALVLGAILPAAAQSLLEEQLEFEPQQNTHTFTGESGQAVIIEMVSEDFDTFITLLTPAGEILEQNDDYDGIPHATIVTELPETGEYTVLAGSFYGQVGGSYQLTVKSATDYQRVYDRALELMQSEDFSEAAEAFSAAIVLTPDQPNAYLGRADALLRQQALLLGDSLEGPNNLPADLRDDVVENYETAAQLLRASGQADAAAFIQEQADFIRSGE